MFCCLSELYFLPKLSNNLSQFLKSFLGFLSFFFFVFWFSRDSRITEKRNPSSWITSPRNNDSSSFMPELFPFLPPQVFPFSFFSLIIIIITIIVIIKSCICQRQLLSANVCNKLIISTSVLRQCIGSSSVPAASNELLFFF